MKMLHIGSKLALVSALALTLSAVAANITSVRVRGAEPALKDLMPKGTLIGAAINQAQSDQRDETSIAIVEHQFNTISPENLLKWGLVHTEPDRYNFEP